MSAFDYKCQLREEPPWLLCDTPGPNLPTRHRDQHLFSHYSVTITAVPAPHLLISCTCRVTRTRLHLSLATTPTNQPHLQLVSQSAAAYKIRTLTYSLPDCALQHARLSSVNFLPVARDRLCLYWITSRRLFTGKPACLPSLTTRLCALFLDG